jgi:hypothetical protein
VIVDRISTLRNVEAALRRFERGEADLHETEREVVNALRTYATDFEFDPDREDGRVGSGVDGGRADGEREGSESAAGSDAGATEGTSDRAAYRVAVDEGAVRPTAAEGPAGGRRRRETVVVATSRAAARELALEHLDVRADAGPGDVTVDRI